MRHYLPLLLLLIIPLYVVTVYALPMTINVDCNDAKGGTDQVGFCTEIGFDVQRSYYFGLLNLPVYRMGMNLDLLHRIVPALTVLTSGGLLWYLRRDEEDEADGEIGYSYQP